ncbi:MAG: MoaD/ThiS family protein, partial [Candidatus Aminicenantales bacterium]
MAVTIKFFAYFREAFGGKEIEVSLAEAPTVGALLDRLGNTPERRAELFAGPALKPHLVIMVNGAPLTADRLLQAPLKDGDV